MMSDDVTMNNHTSITILGSYRAVWHLSKVLKKLTMAMKRIYKCCNYYIMHICWDCFTICQFLTIAQQ